MMRMDPSNSRILTTASPGPGTYPHQNIISYFIIIFLLLLPTYIYECLMSSDNDTKATHMLNIIQLHILHTQLW